MPIPATKIYISSAIASGDAYELLAPAPGDLFQTVTGTPAAAWVAGITDLNGDSIPDFIVGAPGSDDKDVNAGRIFAVFGSATGGTTATLGDIVGEVILDGIAIGDLAGATVGSVTNLNSDSRAEILVGAPYMENGALTDAGAAFVIWGLSTGGVDLGDPANGDGKGYSIKGQAADDHAGTTLTSITDLNGDGKADILVGAPGNDAAGNDAGAVYVVWGKSTTSIVNLSSVAVGAGGFRILGQGNHDRAGESLSSVSDLNGDGKAEILIGAPGNEDGGADAGAVYVVFGKSTGAEVNLDNIASGVGGFRITGSTGDQVGAAVSGIGDINGDGKADILVGAPGSGAVYVVYGKATTAEVLLSDVASGVGGFIIVPEAAGDLSGMSIAAGGDFNRDGINDIIIGAPNNEEGGVDAGAVYIVWGGINSIVNLSLVSEGIGGAKIVGDAGTLFGSSVATLGDLNGDGTPDLLIGSPGAAHESVSVLFAPDSWQPDNNIYGTNGADNIGPGYGGVHTVGTGNDTILALSGDDTVSAASGNDSIEGNDGNDSLDGGAGADSLDGGTGADTIAGGSDNDVYYVDDAGDVTSEDAASGADTVVASVDYALGDNIEALQLAGFAQTGIGNDLANAISGTGGDDYIDGGAGADTMAGGDGSDVYVVDEAGDLVQEDLNGGLDTIISALDYTLGDNIEGLQLAGTAHTGSGNSLNNTIAGGTGDDTLDGASGADTMAGGDGNDLYYADTAADVAQEGFGGGSDTVIASVAYTLGVNVEELQLTGSAHSGTGNTLANTIIGTVGDDSLDGAGGNDTMAGGLGNDTYKVDSASDAVTEISGGGNDTVIASVDYTLGGNIEGLQLAGSAHSGTGNSDINSIAGGTGSDSLDGAGGAGNDNYQVDDSGDVVTELAGQGVDTVNTSLSNYTLTNEVENLVHSGAADFSGSGNAADNSIVSGGGNDSLSGLSGKDTIDGGDGADTIDGGDGNDSLIGGAGASNDSLIGGAGDDTLDGASGADTMAGGDGNDTYYIDNINDVVIENDGGGTDTVFVNFDWTLNPNIESVQITGSGHTVTGNDAANRLSGGSGSDTIDGGAGDDTELGGDGNDELRSGSGHDTLAGGSGDDRYVLTGGSAHIEDFLGNDTIDASQGVGDNSIDLSGDTISHVEGQDCDLGNGGTTVLPLDVQFLQDLSGSFGDDIANVRTLVPQIVSALQAVQPNIEFGSSTFVDKAVSPFGASGEWVYQTYLPLTTNVAALTTTYNNMIIRFGNDEPEAQIESLMQLALHSSEVGFRVDSARFVVLFTDAPFHNAGDGVAGGIVTPNNGDAIMDGTPAGTGEDYPSITQVTNAVISANIIPIFAIANNYESVYQTLVTQLGRGAVVTLTSNSSNVVSAITSGLTAATVTTIENAIGGAGNDSLTGNAVANDLAGNDGNDVLSGAAGADSLHGGAGSDTLTGGTGNDSIDGGDGSDKAVFSGSIADYTVTTLGGTTTVTDNRGGTPDGTDTLTNVEVLQFSDGTVSLVSGGNHAPQLDTPIFDQAATEDAPFLFTLPANTFSDVDLGDALTLSATLANGDALPTWLFFNAATGAFSGTPVNGDVGTISVKVTATDTAAATASDVFDLAVANVNDAPTAVGTSGTLTENLPAGAYVATVSATDVDSAVLFYSITGGDPGGLFAIDSAGVITTTAPLDFETASAYSLTVTVSDGALSDTAIVAVTVTDVVAGDTVTLPDGGASLAVGPSLGFDQVNGGSGIDTLTVTLPATDSAHPATVKASLDGTKMLIDINGDGTTDLSVAGVEELVLNGPYVKVSGDLSGTGLALHTITYNGDTGANVFDASGLTSAEDVVANGFAGADTLIGAGGNDALSGGDDADSLTGNAGNDTLDGGAGTDRMTGGLGNDVYVVDNAGDVVTEASASGTDTILTTLSAYTLFTNVENLTYAGSGDFTGIGNTAGNLLTGGSGNDTLSALSGNDTLLGGDGNDTLDTGTGNNSVQGGIGDDSILGGTGNDTLDGGDGADTIDGGAGNDSIEGDSGTGNDVLLGGLGNDTLNGMAGADTMTGGAGNDTYVVDDGGDLVTENPGEGTDTAKTTLSSYQLTADVENLTFIGSGDFFGTGNDAGNSIIGGTGNDTLDGGSGIDRLAGGAGNDAYIVDNLLDVVTEGTAAGNDTVFTALDAYTLGKNVETLTYTGVHGFAGTGNTLANAINGGNGNDTLSGGKGADTMTGGLGDDVYVVDNIGDVVTENSGEGTDMVQSSIAYTLSSDVENLQLTGASGIGGTGNAGGNVLTGNAGNNVLAGLGGADTVDGGGGIDTATYAASSFAVNVSLATGLASGGDAESDSLISIENLIGSGLNDTLEGDAGNNVLNGGAGIDTVSYEHASGAVAVSLAVGGAQITGNAGTDTLTLFENLNGSSFSDSLTGSTANNVLTGLDGNDTISGGTGADTMAGGFGDDVFIVDNIGDVVSENYSEGTDAIQSTVSYALNDNIENLLLTGSGGTNGTGNNDDNILTGNAKNNVLTGLDGNDTLNGGLGNDTLNGGTGTDLMTGGLGADRFVFTANDTPAGGALIGEITDFSHAQLDKIDLSAIDANGTAGSAFTFPGGSPANGFTHIAGQLHYVVNGIGGVNVEGDTDGDGTADFIIQVDGVASLTASDFVL